MRTLLVGGLRRVPLVVLLAMLALSVAMSAPPVDEPAGDAGKDGPLYEIKFKFDPEVALYYTIEDEFRDSGSVPGWLSYSTSVSDRRSIVQKVIAPASGPASAPAVPAGSKSGSVAVSWECDRYEVRERAPKGGEVVFDSLRDLYPPPSLYALGGVAGSRCTFSIDPATGGSSNLKMVPGQVEGPATFLKPSRTASRCALSEKTLADLLHDLGPLFMPGAPKHVGDQWTNVQTDAVDTFGTVITNLTCTLRGVREVDGRLIASIELTGDVELAKAPGATASEERPASAPGSQPESATASTQPASSEAASAPATTQPTSSAPAEHRPPASGRTARQSTEKEFVLDTAVCAGSVEFDLTRGELVELTLRRELAGAAKFEVEKTDPLIPTEIRAGTMHVRRVRVSRTAPTRPIIVGGRKPPVIPPDQAATTRPVMKKAPLATQPRQLATPASAPTSAPRHHPATRPGTASRPVSGTPPGIPYGPPSPPGLGATTQPASGMTRPTGRPVRPPEKRPVPDQERPTSRPGSMGRPTTQPASTATQPARPPAQPGPSAP